MSSFALQAFHEETSGTGRNGAKTRASAPLSQGFVTAATRWLKYIKYINNLWMFLYQFLHWAL